MKPVTAYSQLADNLDRILKTACVYDIDKSIVSIAIPNFVNLINSTIKALKSCENNIIKDISSIATCDSCHDNRLCRMEYSPTSDRYIVYARRNLKSDWIAVLDFHQLNWATSYVERLKNDPNQIGKLISISIENKKSIMYYT